MFINRTAKLYSRQWNSKRFYQSLSEDGVYGYRYSAKADFKVPDEVLKSRHQQSNLYRWIEAYRTHGHRIARVNPVEFMKQERNIPELDHRRYDLNLEQIVNFNGLITTNEYNKKGTIKSIETFLQKTYCETVSAEFSYIESEQEKEWIQSNYELYLSKLLSQQDKIEIAELLIKSQVWDNFMATKFPAVKRYGCEGAETMLAFFRQIFLSSAENDIKNIVLGMNHRGKLNLLTTMLKTRPAKMFRHYKGLSDLPDDAKCMGDIPSHFHVSAELIINRKKIRMSLLHNPSHLEAVNPVSMGKARSKIQSLKNGPFSNKIEDSNLAVLNIQVHGDAAFPGQGINQEMLMMAATPHFDIDGTIHLIVNNQIGFTTPADRGRSTRYCTDLAKSIMAPVFHVNVDDPEKLTLVTNLAFDYWNTFKKDVFIDLNCFRRWGHNELDDPTFTNPLLYNQIHNRKSVPNLFADKLIEQGDLSSPIIDRIANQHKNYLTKELANIDSFKPDTNYFGEQWHGLQQATNSITYWDTGLDYNLLRFIGEKSVYLPTDFNIHSHLLKTHINARLKKLETGKIDWSTAEAFAMGSLLYQGHNIRLSGEDVGRGTFSQRHAMLIDQKTNEIFIPLNTIEGKNIGKLEIANSILSEEAVLGFEYGMAIDNPNNLIIWEAQFGDFFNGAQIIFDTFIFTGESKWLYCNGLVILLPHGFDGAGSEHSSCRLERFLQQTDSKESLPDGDDVNFQIINPTTPAQYYHALRRQIIRNFRKPLVVVAPKTLLRLSDATSIYSEFEHGQFFKPIIDDDLVFTSPDRIKRIIFCSGKHFYNLNAKRLEEKIYDTAIIRVESLCPFPVNEINQTIIRYKNAKVFIWSQEEPRNMGAWSFIKPRFENMCGNKIKYYGRCEGATVAVGTSSWHKKEAIDVVTSPFILK